MGKTSRGSRGSPSPCSALPGGPSVLQFADDHARGTCPAPRHQHPTGTAMEPRVAAGNPGDARTRHAHLFLLPFSPAGKQSSLLSMCSRQAWGSSPRCPTVPRPRGPGRELGSSSARVSSPALLQPLRAGQGEQGGEGREEGSGEMKL